MRKTLAETPFSTEQERVMAARVTTQPDGGRVDAKSEDGRTNDDGRRERILRLIVRT